MLAQRPLPEPRSAVASTPPTHHGAFDYGELAMLRLPVDRVLDFSVNSNPFGPSPRVAIALQSVPLERYPDRDALALRRALSPHLDVPLEQIVVGNGTAELIHLIAFAYVRQDDCALIIGPTFGEYARAAGLMGGKVITYTAQEERALGVDAFGVDNEAVARLIEVHQPYLLFICRPNNPTGTLAPLDDIAAWADQRPQMLVIVDEAYLAFAAGAQSALVLNRPNILVLRSMTKDYALAGLRLGYAAGHAQIISTLASVRPAWNVNALAQAAGIAALGDQDHLQRTLALLAQAKCDFANGLQEVGLRPLPSNVHFFLVRVGHAADFRQKLLLRGIQVRDCTSFGLPAYVRIATRRPEENDYLLRIVREVLS